MPQAHGERYRELISDARLEIIGDCGHAPLLEQPGRTVEAIGRFHAGLAAKGAC